METQELNDKYFLHLSKRLGTKWKDLAIILGFTDANLQTFEANNRGDLNEQCRKMLVDWFARQESREDASRILSEALREAGCVDLAKEVPEIPGQASSKDLEYCQHQVIQFYKDTRSNFPAHPSFPARTVSIDEFFTPLELSLKEKFKTSRTRARLHGKLKFLDKVKTAVHLATWEDLFKPQIVEELKVLLSGGAGYGKSVLLMQVANTWTKGGLLAKFKLVFLLKLRQMRKTNCIIDAIFDQILPQNTKLKKTGLIKMVDDHEAETAFLLDGLDEIPSEVLNSTEGKYSLHNVLYNRVFVKSCVLVTSRPHMIDYIFESRQNYAHVEISGFTTNSINIYIEMYFADDPSVGKALISNLESKKSLQTLAQIPLITLMVCIVWKNLESLPRQLTELYSQFASTLVGCRGDKDHERRQKMVSILNGLGRIALNGILDSLGERLIFFSEEFEDCVSILEYGCRFGFLQWESITSGLEVKRVVTFFHKSFQEYYAAYYLASLLHEDESSFHAQLELIHLDNVHRMEYLLRFCCGLSFEAAGFVLEHLKNMVAQHERQKRLQGLARSLLFESDSKELVSKLDRPTEVECNCKEDLVSLQYYLECIPRDQPLVGVPLGFIVCSTYDDLTLLRDVLLSVNLRSTRLEGVIYTMSEGRKKEMRHLEETLGLIDERLRGRCQLGLQINQKSSFDAECVSEYILRIASRVECFTLVIGRRSHRDVTSIVNALKTCRLYGFSLHHINMHGHVRDLASVGTQSLKQLALDKCELADDDVQDLISILPAGHDLNELYLDGNAFSLNAVKNLTDYLQSFLKLTTLSLDNIGIDQENVKQLVWQILPNIKCYSLEDVVLLRNVLPTDEFRLNRVRKISCIISAQGTQEMQHLEETLEMTDRRLRDSLKLRLHVNEMSAFDVIHMSGCISRMSSQVKSFILVIASRQHRDVTGIVESLTGCRLDCFALHYTNMHSHVTDLAPLVTPSLKELTLNTCGLVDDDVMDLIRILPSWHGLERLFVSGNAFSMRAVQTLIDYLRSYPQLLKLSLDIVGLDKDLVQVLALRSLPNVECTTYEDLILLRHALGDNFRSTRIKRVIYVMSVRGTKEMQHLEDTIKQTDERFRGRLKLNVQIQEKASFDVKPVSGCISRLSSQVGSCTLVMDGRSPYDVINLVSAVKECELYCFGLHHTNMRGHVADLAPVVSPSLKELTLNACGLVDGDVTDLISILPTGHGLERIYVNNNAFSLSKVNVLIDYLKGFPQLTKLSLDDSDVDEGLVKQGIWQICPDILCNSVEELMMLRDVLRKTHPTCPRLKRVICNMSAQGTKEMQLLEEILGITDERLHGKLQLQVHINEKSSFDARYLSRCFSHMSSYVESFTLVIERRPYRDVASIVNALKACHLYGIELLYINMHGHVADMAPLVTPSLKELAFYTCGLVDDDIPDLISILPTWHGLELLFLDGNAFSLNAVKGLTHHLRDSPELIKLSLNNNGIDEDLTKQEAWQGRPDIGCSSYEDLMLLRDFLLRCNQSSTRLKRVICIMSAQGTKEMQHLQETLEQTDERVRGRLHLRLDINDKSHFDAEYVLRCIASMSDQVEKFTIVMDRRSHHDVVTFANALGQSGLFCFGIHRTNMHGHVTDLAPLVTPSLKQLTLNTCGLVDDDILDLIRILPAGHGLEKLYANCNAFSLDAVEALANHLQTFPQLAKLSLENIGLDEDLVKRLVWKLFPDIECSSYEDLTSLRNILLCSNPSSTRLKRVIHIMSTQGTKEIQHLEKTFRETDEKVRGQLEVNLQIQEKASFDAESVSGCISRLSSQVGSCTLVMDGRSPHDVIGLVSGLKGCQLNCLGLHHTNIHGYVASLVSLASPSLKELQLTKCGLRDDDITGLINILPAGCGLEMLVLDDNSFSLNAVKLLADHLRGFPDLNKVSLNNVGLDEDLVNQEVWQILPYIRCNSYEDLTLLRKVLQRGNLTSTQLKTVIYTMTAQGTKEMRCFEESIVVTDKGLRGRLQIKLHIDEKSYFDAVCVSGCISRISNLVGSFTLVIEQRSHRDVSNIVNALKKCRLYCFELRHTNIHGHVTPLAPLVTPALKRLTVDTCGLVDDDVKDLVNILPAWQGLEMFVVAGNAFSEDAVKALAEHFQAFPNLALSLDVVGLDDDCLKRLLWEVFPNIECSSYEDLKLLRDVLLSGNLRSTRCKRVSYIVPAQGIKEMQYLEETLGQTDSGVRGRLHLVLYVIATFGFDVNFLSGCISRMSNLVGNCTLVMNGQMYHDVTGVVEALKECRLHGFGLHYSGISGHVTDLAPLVTPSLKELHLNTCGLLDDDVKDLIRILPNWNGLEILVMSGNAFSLDAVNALVNHLRGLSALTTVLLDNVNLDTSVVKRLIRQILPVFECSSLEDLALLRNILLSGNVRSTRIRKIIMSVHETEEMKHLEETLRQTDERLRCQFELKIQIHETTSFDAQSMSGYISRLSNQVGRCTLTLDRRSHRDIIGVVNALKQSSFYGVSVTYTNLLGHVADLTPLVTPSLKDLELNTCGLTDDDVTDLIRILPASHGLRNLSVGGNAFSLNAVQALTSHLRGFPDLTKLSLGNTGLPNDLVKQLVWQILSNIECNSYEDLVLLRKVLKDDVRSTRLIEVANTVSTQVRNMQHLEETLGLTDRSFREQLQLEIRIDEKSRFDGEFVSGCISRISKRVGSCILVLVRRSHRDVISTVNALNECCLSGFQLRYTDMRGQVTKLTPVVTPSLKRLVLSSCGLIDDDLEDLVSIFPADHGLEELDLEGNTFSSSAVKSLTGHLRGSCPKFTTLSCDSTGL